MSSMDEQRMREIIREEIQAARAAHDAERRARSQRAFEDDCKAMGLPPEASANPAEYVRNVFGGN